MIVILGSNGMFGRALVRYFSETKECFTALSRNDINLHYVNDIVTVLCKVGAKIVYNCVAYTNVDAAENNRDEAYKANSTIPENIAKACKKIGAKFVHYSTDYVFKGDAKKHYKEDSPVEPINWYGFTKLSGEIRVKSVCEDFLIIRTSCLYAPWGNNFVNKICDLVKTNDSIDVVCDQYSNPTSVFTLAKHSDNLVKGREHGMFHVTDLGSCSRYKLALEINKILGEKCKINPIFTYQMKQSVKRPLYSALDTTKTIQSVGYLPDWKISLFDTIKEKQCHTT